MTYAEYRAAVRRLKDATFWARYCADTALNEKAWEWYQTERAKLDHEYNESKAV